jgi:hypothetical protein
MDIDVATASLCDERIEHLVSETEYCERLHVQPPGPSLRTRCGV